MIEDFFRRVRWGKVLFTIMIVVFLFSLVGFFLWLSLWLGVEGQVDFSGGCSGKDGQFYKGAYEEGNLYDCKERVTVNSGVRCLCQVDDPVKAGYECNYCWDCGNCDSWECVEHKCYYEYMEKDPSLCAFSGCFDVCSEGASKDKICSGDKVLYSLCIGYSSGTQWVVKEYDCSSRGLRCSYGDDGVAGCYDLDGCVFGSDRYYLGEKVCSDVDGDGVFFTYACDRSGGWAKVGVLPCQDLSSGVVEEVLPVSPDVVDVVSSDDVVDDEGCLLSGSDCEDCQEFVEDLCECFDTSSCFGFDCELSADDCGEGMVFDADFCQCFVEGEESEWKEQYFQDNTVVVNPIDKVKQEVVEFKGWIYVVLGIFFLIGVVVLFFLFFKKLRKR